MFVSLTTGRSLCLLQGVHYVNCRGGVSWGFFVLQLSFWLLLHIFILRVSYVYPTCILRVSYVYPTCILRVSYVFGRKKFTKLVCFWLNYLNLQSISQKSCILRGESSLR